MAKIRFNLQNIENYIQQNLLEYSDNDKATIISIFDECNTIFEEGETKEERRLTEKEITEFFEKIKAALPKFFTHIENFIKNMNLQNSFEYGNKLINQFNLENPNVKSSTWLGARGRDILRKSGNKDEANALFEEAVKLENSTNGDNMNCEQRARELDRIMVSHGFNGNKAVVLIHGDQNLDEGYIYGAHVFNVINLDDNAIISDTETWGNNAVIVDAWAGKVFKPDEAIKFYRDFLGYDYDNQPLNFEEI